MKNIFCILFLLLFLPGMISAQCSVTQSNNTTSIIQFNSVACHAGGRHTDNFYYRAFDLSSCGAAGSMISVSDIDLGIEVADAGGAATSQPMTINLYTMPTGTFPTGFVGGSTLVGTADFNVADQALSIENFAVTSSPITIGAVDLIVEVFTPNGQAVGHRFFIGSNPNGQTGLSYIAAPACGINAPANIGSVGFPNMHTVMTVNLVPPGGLPVPTMGEWGLITLALLLLITGMLFMTAPKLATSQNQSVSIPMILQNLTFDKKLFLKILPMVGLVVLGFFTAIVTWFGYEWTSADPIGILVTVPLASYMLMLVVEAEREE